MVLGGGCLGASRTPPALMDLQLVIWKPDTTQVSGRITVYLHLFVPTYILYLMTAILQTGSLSGLEIGRGGM